MSASVTPLRRKNGTGAFKPADPVPTTSPAPTLDREATRSFTSWKLDIVDAMISDPRVRDRDFRVAFRVMQAVNSETRVAILSDLTLCDDVPFTDRFRLNDVRKRLTKHKWWTVERGHGSKASRYLFSPANINDVLDQRALDKEARDAVRQSRKNRDKRRKANREGRGRNDHINTSGGRGQFNHGDVVEMTTGTPSLLPSKTPALKEEAQHSEDDEALTRSEAEAVAREERE